MTGTVAKAVGKVARADRKATHKAAESRDEPLVRLAGFLSEAADQPPLIAASIGTFGVGLVTRRADLMRGGARMLAAHLVATGLKSAVKHRIDRARPAKAIEDGKTRFARGHSHDHDLNSFPSGHTAGAVAVARAASRDIDGAGVPATIATIAVAAAQAPSGHHYLSDVVAGAAIGWIAEALVSAVFDRIEPAVEHGIADLREAAAG